MTSFHRSNFSFVVRPFLEFAPVKSFQESRTGLPRTKKLPAWRRYPIKPSAQCQACITADDQNLEPATPEHCVRHTPNENKMSYRWRERALLQFQMWKSSKSRYHNGQR